MADFEERINTAREELRKYLAAEGGARNSPVPKELAHAMERLDAVRISSCVDRAMLCAALSAEVYGLRWTASAARMDALGELAARAWDGHSSVVLAAERVLHEALQQSPSAASIQARGVLGEMIRRTSYKGILRVVLDGGLVADEPDPDLQALPASRLAAETTRHVSVLLVELLTQPGRFREWHDEELYQRLRLKTAKSLERRSIVDWDRTTSLFRFVAELLGTGLLKHGKYNGARSKYLLPFLFPDDLIVRPVLRCPGCGRILSVSPCPNAGCADPRLGPRDTVYWLLRIDRWRAAEARRCSGPNCAPNGVSAKSKGKGGILHLVKGRNRGCSRGCPREFLSERPTEVWIPGPVLALPGYLGGRDGWCGSVEGEEETSWYESK